MFASFAKWSALLFFVVIAFIIGALVGLGVAKDHPTPPPTDQFQVAHGFTPSQSLQWKDAGDGMLIADTSGGGVCLQVDRNGADGIFCSGAVSEAEGAPEPDGAAIYNWLTLVKSEAPGQPVAAQPSRAERYEAVQREMRQSLQALENLSR